MFSCSPTNLIVLVKSFSVLEYDDVGLLDVLRKADPQRNHKYYAETYDPAGEWHYASLT